MRGTGPLERWEWPSGIASPNRGVEGSGFLSRSDLINKLKSPVSGSDIEPSTRT